MYPSLRSQMLLNMITNKENNVWPTLWSHLLKGEKVTLQSRKFGFTPVKNVCNPEHKHYFCVCVQVAVFVETHSS